MKTQTKNLLPVILVFLFAQFFISCQKNNESTGNSITANSIDNSINTLPVDSSLVAWYPFHHGQLVDKSGKGNRIVFCSATPVASRSGQDSGAYYFDGTSSYMRVKNSLSLNPPQSITLAALIKPMGFYQGLCHYNRILVKSVDDFSNGRIELGFSDQPSYNFNGCAKPVRERKENFYGGYGNGSLMGGLWDTISSIKTDKWYTLIFTYDGEVLKLYVNNELVNSIVATTPFTPNNTDLFIGQAPSLKFPYNFNGVIDEIRIYNRALSPNEILSLNNVMGSD